MSYQYAEDLDADIIHLTGPSPIEQKTLCGIRLKDSDFYIGDETLTGIATDCPACKEILSNNL